MSLIYLDNAASTPLHPIVADELKTLWADNFVNPSAGHQPARELRKRLELAARQLTLSVGATDARLLWLSGGTEANNLALRGTFRADHPLTGTHVVATVTEHPSVLAPLEDLARNGAEVSLIPVRGDGRVDEDGLQKALRPETNLVSIGLVQGETGVIQDLAAVRSALDQFAPKALFHVDAVQGVGKLPLHWENAGIDLLSMAGHKFHGPGSIGVLLSREGIKLHPMMLGGGQQDGLRSGSLDPVAILAFCRAFELLHQDKDLLPRVRELNAQLRAGLQQLPTEIKIISPEDASPFILSFSLPEHEGAVIMRMLADRGIIVSTGSACSADSREPSRILTAMGISRKVAFGALRASFGQQSRPTDVEGLLSALEQILADY